MAIKKYIGFEFEMVYNAQKINIRRGEYHRGVKIGEYWNAQRDASIQFDRYSGSNWDNWGYPVEIVSYILDSKNKVKKALAEFKQIFSKNGEFELHEVIQFTQTTGSHIHFSTKKNKREIKYKHFISSDVLRKARAKVLKEIKNSDISSKRIILRRFFRDYAQQNELDTKSYNSTTDRRKEYNFYSEMDNKGFEWRSPNLTGIKTWAEFDLIMRIYLKIVEFMQKKLLKDKHTETIILEEDITPQEKTEILQLNTPMRL